MAHIFLPCLERSGLHSILYLEGGEMYLQIKGACVYMACTDMDDCSFDDLSLPVLSYDTIDSQESHPGDSSTIKQGLLGGLQIHIHCLHINRHQSIGFVACLCTICDDSYR